jgi:hypothetical protein
MFITRMTELAIFIKKSVLFIKIDLTIDPGYRNKV